MKLKSRAPREINGKELHAIEYLASFETRLRDFEADLEPRLRNTPDGWRNYRIAKSCASKAVDAVYDSVDDLTRYHMSRLADSYEVIIRPKNRVIDNKMVLADSRHLNTLVNTSMAAECAICIKEDAEIRKCQLRKALMFTAPPSRIPDNGRCPYSEIALCHDLGAYTE